MSRPGTLRSESPTVKASIDRRIAELEAHAQAVRHSRDYWADRAHAVEAAVAEYINASIVNVPADRVQKAWEKLRLAVTFR